MEYLGTDFIYNIASNKILKEFTNGEYICYIIISLTENHDYCFIFSYNLTHISNINFLFISNFMYIFALLLILKNNKI